MSNPPQSARVAVVSDVSVGFGSPQVQSLARSLAAHYQLPATIYEPDQSGRPPRFVADGEIPVHRAATESSPFSTAGRIEYVLHVAEELNRERPSVVAFFCTFTLPVLVKLHYRPRVVVYDLIEMVAPYGEQDIALNRHLAAKIDVLIFPEENRARLDMQRCGFGGKPMAVVYNVSDAPSTRVVHPSNRQRRLFYGGAISSDLGLADFLLHPEMASVPLDLYGDVAGPDQAALREQLQGTVGEPRYHGCVDAKTLATLRRNYAYSIVMYRPTLEHTLYAAPNKFFEAVADGVPPIVAPHPQCKLLVERYECGIVMRDWSFEAYRDAVELALSAYGTRRYRRLVRNCLRAVRAELNWGTQFAKVRALLPAA